MKTRALAIAAILAMSAAARADVHVMNDQELAQVVAGFEMTSSAIATSSAIGADDQGTSSATASSFTSWEDGKPTAGAFAWASGDSAAAFSSARIVVPASTAVIVLH